MFPLDWSLPPSDCPTQTLHLLGGKESNTLEYHQIYDICTIYDRKITASLVVKEGNTILSDSEP